MDVPGKSFLTCLMACLMLSMFSCGKPDPAKPPAPVQEAVVATPVPVPEPVATTGEPVKTDSPVAEPTSE